MSLFSSLTLRDVTIRNRIAVSPMCMYSSEEGFANDWHLVHLGARAVGGAGLVLTEATAVAADGRISPQDLGIWADEHIEPLARVTRFIREYGAVAGIQLAHAGRKASTAAPGRGSGAVAPEDGGWLPVWAPSAVPFSDSYPMPTALEPEGIRGVVAAFAAAAGRAREAGFQVVEIHAAHGYLLHEFLSPLSNRREDEYGGSFENRTRLVRQVVEAVREVWPESLPLIVRISSTDWIGGGWSDDDSVALARLLAPLGVDLMDCSSGGIATGVKIPLGPGYQTRFAERVRREAGLASGAVGMITSPQQADHVIRTGQADLVIMARQFLREPYWPLRAARELGVDLTWPRQYVRAKI